MLQGYLMQRRHFRTLITFLVSVWDYLASAFARLIGHGQKRDPSQLPLTTQSNPGAKAKAISKPICSQAIHLRSSITERLEGLDTHARGPYESPRSVPSPPEAIYTPEWLNTPLNAGSWRHGGYYDLEFDVEQVEGHTQVESLANTSSQTILPIEPYPNFVMDLDQVSEELQPIICARTNQERFTPTAWNHSSRNTTAPDFLEEPLIQADPGTKSELGRRRGFKGAPLRLTGGRKSSFLSLPDALTPRTSGPRSSTPRSPLSSVTNFLSPASTTTSRISKEMEIVDDLQLLFNQYDPFGCSSRSFYTPAFTPLLNGNVYEMNDFTVYMPQAPTEWWSSTKKSSIRGNTSKNNKFRVNMRTTIYDASVYDVLLPVSQESVSSPTAIPLRIKQWSPSRPRGLSTGRKKQRAVEIVFTTPTEPASPIRDAPSIAALPTTTAEHALPNIDRLGRARLAGESPRNYSALDSDCNSIPDTYCVLDGSPSPLASTLAWERCHVATKKTLSTEGMATSMESPLFDPWNAEDISSSDISISTLGASLPSSATSEQFPTPQRPIRSASQESAGDMSSYTLLPVMTDAGERVYQCSTCPLPAAIKAVQGLGNGRVIKHQSAPIPVRKPNLLDSGMSKYGGDPFVAGHGEVGCKASTEVWPSASDSNRMDDNGDGVESKYGCDIKRGDGDIESLGVGVIRDNESDNLQGSFYLGCHHSPGAADDSVLHCDPANALKKLQERGIRDGGVRNVREVCRPGTKGGVDERGSRDGRQTDNFLDGDQHWEMGYQSQSQSQHSHPKRRRPRQMKHERGDMDQQPTFKDDSTPPDEGARKPIVEAHHDHPLRILTTMTEVHPAKPSLTLHTASTRQRGISVVTEEIGSGRKLNVPVASDGSKMGMNAGVDASLLSADGHDLDGFKELTLVARDKRSSKTGRSASITRMTKLPENIVGGAVGSPPASNAIDAGPNRPPTPRDMRVIGVSKSAEYDVSMVRRNGSGGVVGRLVQNWEGKMLDTAMNQSTRGRTTSIGSDKTKGSV